MCFTVVVSPAQPGKFRSVLIQDEQKRMVAVMNTHDTGWEHAVATAVAFSEAANTREKLEEAEETIKGLRLQLSNI